MSAGSRRGRQGTGRRGARSRSASSDEPEPLGSVLDVLAAGRPWSAGLALGELARRWPEVVGDTLSRECSPARLDGQVLVVEASTGPWATQVRFLAQEVRRRANAALGSDLVAEVRVGVAAGGRQS